MLAHRRRRSSNINPGSIQRLVRVLFEHGASSVDLYDVYVDHLCGQIVRNSWIFAVFEKNCTILFHIFIPSKRVKK